MKKWMISICLVMAVSMNVSACGAKPQAQEKQPQAETEASREKEPDAKTVRKVQNSKNSKKETGQTALKRMFRYQKKLYIETGEISSATARCGVMDGQITSSVAADKIPKKNNQSNFGSDYGFQYGNRKNRLEVCIDGKWCIFAYNENNFDGVSMQVIKSSPSKATIRILNTTKLQVQYGEDFALEVKNKKTGRWGTVPFKAGYGYHCIAYQAAKDTSVKWKVNWGRSHGKLKPGTYRIVKSFMDYRGTGDYTEYTLSAEFKVSSKKSPLP